MNNSDVESVTTNHNCIFTVRVFCKRIFDLKKQFNSCMHKNTQPIFSIFVSNYQLLCSKIQGLHTNLAKVPINGTDCTEVCTDRPLHVETVMPTETTQRQMKDYWMCSAICFSQSNQSVYKACEDFLCLLTVHMDFKVYRKGSLLRIYM